MRPSSIIVRLGLYHLDFLYHLVAMLYNFGIMRATKIMIIVNTLFTFFMLFLM